MKSAECVQQQARATSENNVIKGCMWKEDWHVSRT